MHEAALRMPRLRSGGLITNYYCTSRCGHCLYGCSPRWERRYIDAETARRNLQAVRECGCNAVHVGGGEPFLNPGGLGEVLDTAREAGVRVEYVETNSSWYRDKESAVALLTDLKGRGLRTLLVSISPFHNEHIPFARVQGVLEACRAARVQVWPWIAEFAGEVGSFDPETTHSLAEYSAKFGADYLAGFRGATGSTGGDGP